MPPIEIHGTVGSGHYWADGNHCAAENILITGDDIKRTEAEAHDADNAKNIVRQPGHTEAPTCMKTRCKTFTPCDRPHRANTRAREDH